MSSRGSILAGTHILPTKEPRWAAAWVHSQAGKTAAICSCKCTRLTPLPACFFVPLSAAAAGSATQRGTCQVLDCEASGVGGCAGGARHVGARGTRCSVLFLLALLPPQLCRQHLPAAAHRTHLPTVLFHLSPTPKHLSPYVTAPCRSTRLRWCASATA